MQNKGCFYLAYSCHLLCPERQPKEGRQKSQFESCGCKRGVVLLWHQPHRLPPCPPFPPHPSLGADKFILHSLMPTEVGQQGTELKVYRINKHEEGASARETKQHVLREESKTASPKLWLEGWEGNDFSSGALDALKRGGWGRVHDRPKGYVRVA